MKQFSLLIPLLFITGYTGYSHADNHANHNTPSVTYGGIALSNVWIREAPPNARTLALFMSVTNLSDKHINIIGAHAQDYDRVELHRTINAEGVMKMIKQNTMPIAAGGSLMLEPGSWHIMLIGPKKTPTLNEQVMIRLDLDNNSSLIFAAVVKKDHSAVNATHTHNH